MASMKAPMRGLRICTVTLKNHTVHDPFGLRLEISSRIKRPLTGDRSSDNAGAGLILGIVA